MSVVYVLTTPKPEDGGDNLTVDQVRKRAKWYNDDYVCRGLILNGMSDSLFDIYQNVESSKELWDSLKAKYMAEDASNFKRTLKHKKDELTLIELGNHLRVEESLKDEALDKFKVFKTKVESQQRSQIKRFRTDRGGEYMDTMYFQSVGIIHETNAPYTSQQNGTSKRKNRVLKEMVNSILSYSGLSQGFWGEAMAVLRHPDPKLKTLGEIGIECIFVGYAEHSKDFRFYVIEPNDSVAIDSIIKSMDAIFDENRFSLVPRPSLSISKGTEDIGGSVVPEVVTDELYLIEETRDEVFDQHSYCFNVEDDPKAFDEAMKLQTSWLQMDLQKKLKVDETIEKFKARLVIQSFKQKSGIDYFDTYAPVTRISTIRLLIAMASIHNLVIHQMNVKTSFLNDDLDEEFSIKHMGEADVILGIRIKHESNGIAISQCHYIEKVLKKFNYFDCTPVSTPIDTSEKLMPNHGILVIMCWKVTLMQVGSATLKKIRLQVAGYSCITGSTMKFEFMALVAAGKEAEWLKNLLLEIPLWFKPIAPIAIRCDSAATLAKAYSQMYNENSRHLGVRHSMIRELITNGVISIEFVRSQQNLADHLTKGLYIDLVIKSVEGMGLKFNQVAEC
ncbi:zinc finger, CCHC-type containing protein [Tanacetum coccineum]